MEFVVLKEKEFRKFLDKSPLKTFLQTPEVAKVRENTHWDRHYVGVKKDGILVAATMMVSKARRFGKKEFYAPRGFLLDYHDKELLAFFVEEIKHYIKNNNGYKLRIDPYVIFKERDIDGNIVEGGIDNSDIVSCLKSLGFIYNDTPEQVRFMFVLDLDGKSEDDIMKEMKQNTRNIIRRTIKNGIKVRELEYEELPLFLDIMNKTSERKQFEIRSLSYFQNMYKSFHDRGEIKYLVTELDLDEYVNNLKKEIDSEKVKLERIKSRKNKNEKEEASINEAISGLIKKQTEADEIKNKTGQSKIILSGSMFIMVKPEVIYLSSGNYEEYLHFNSQYQIQWEMIQYGIKNGFKRYNFYGISGVFDKNDKDYGIYKFKKGFNGYVEELIGEYELPINKFYYNLFKFIGKLRK